MLDCTYESDNSKNFPLASLIELYSKQGVTKIIYKSLAPNDNSKNQLYVAGHISDLSFLPSGDIVESLSTSAKRNASKRKVKYKASLNLSWLRYDGILYHAKNSKLIYYPQYPEVRLSGFLSGSQVKIGGWMDPSKSGRAEGRELLLGIKENGEILAYLAIPSSRIAHEIKTYESYELTNNFCEIPIKQISQEKASSKIKLLHELERIYKLGWIPSKRLNSKGESQNYTAQNGGGYTLEAELGVVPNGLAGPDFMGWEIKQYGIGSFSKPKHKPITLMTPEPNGGFYFKNGATKFMLKYGYADTKGRDGRFNFNGKHVVGMRNSKTQLLLLLKGFDFENNIIEEASGYVGLIDVNGEIAAKWSFSKLITHWKKKHSKAAYIPSISQIDNTGNKLYHYSNKIQLFESTNINTFLQSFVNKNIYYDPGLKLENAYTAPKTKRRNQFRINSINLSSLYSKSEQVDLVALIK
jgi:hypothetical protein